MSDTSDASVSDQGLRRILDAAGVAMATLDSEGHLCVISTEFARLWARTPSDLVGLHVLGVVAEGDQPELLAGLVRILEGVSDIERCELRVPDHHGRPRHLRVTFGVCSPDDDVVVVVTDLTSAERAERRRRRNVIELARAINEDPGTGLPTGPAIDASIASAVRRSARHGYPFAAMLVSVALEDATDDDREQVADVLTARLADRLRPSDEVCRRDERTFVVLAEDLGDVQDAAGVAYRLLAAAVEPVALDGGPLDVSLTIGVAVADGSVVAQRVLAAAQSALTEAASDGVGGFRIVDLRPDLAA